MNANYRLIQFVPHAENPEPITVGVMLWTEKTVALRLLGDDHLAFGIGRFYADMTGTAENFSDVVLMEWLTWFKALVEIGLPPSKKDLESLDRLSVTSGCFVAPLVGELRTDFDARPRDTAKNLCDQLFNELVLDKPVMRTLLLRDRLVQACRLADLAESNGLIIDAEVELPWRGKQRPMVMHFPVMVRREKTIGFQLVHFDAPPERVSEDVSRVLAVFDVAIRRKVVHPTGCVAVIQPGVAMTSRYVECLQSIASVLEATDLSLVQRIRALTTRAGSAGPPSRRR
ncbi:MAG: hypothetical protein ABI375_00400 [Rudaea sp.]